MTQKPRTSATNEHESLDVLRIYAQDRKSLPHGYDRKTLPKATRERIKEHLQHCGTCMDRFSALLVCPDFKGHHLEPDRY